MRGKPSGFPVFTGSLDNATSTDRTPTPGLFLFSAADPSAVKGNCLSTVLSSSRPEILFPLSPAGYSRGPVASVPPSAVPSQIPERSRFGAGRGVGRFAYAALTGGLLFH